MSKIQQQEPVSVKIVLVGDHLVGKTSICKKYINDDNQSKIQKNKEDNENLIKSFNAIIKVDENILNVGIWDTSIRQGCSNMTRFSYADTDVFLIVFSISNPESLINAINTWYTQVEKVIPNACKIFVGNKEDLRFSNIDDDNQIEILSKQQIRDKLQNNMKKKYLQCSSVTGEGINKIFEQSVRMVLKNRSKQQKMIKKMSLLQKCGSCEVM